MDAPDRDAEPLRNPEFRSQSWLLVHIRPEGAAQTGSAWRHGALLTPTTGQGRPYPRGRIPVTEGDRITGTPERRSAEPSRSGSRCEQRRDSGRESQ